MITVILYIIHTSWVNRYKFINYYRKKLSFNIKKALEEINQSEQKNTLKKLNKLLYIT